MANTKEYLKLKSIVLKSLTVEFRNSGSYSDATTKCKVCYPEPGIQELKVLMGTFNTIPKRKMHLSYKPQTPTRSASQPANPALRSAPPFNISKALDGFRFASSNKPICPCNQCFSRHNTVSPVNARQPDLYYWVNSFERQLFNRNWKNLTFGSILKALSRPRGQPNMTKRISSTIPLSQGWKEHDAIAAGKMAAQNEHGDDSSSIRGSRQSCARDVTTS